MTNNDFISADYRDESDCRRYGSDLNKWVSINCRKNFIVNNIDLIFFDYIQKRIRIIESKHENEECGLGQKNILKELSKLYSDNLKIDVYIIRGNYPYSKCEIIRIIDYGKKTVDDLFLLKFLNFEIEFDDL